MNAGTDLCGDHDRQEQLEAVVGLAGHARVELVGLATERHVSERTVQLLHPHTFIWQYPLVLLAGAVWAVLNQNHRELRLEQEGAN